MPSLSLYLFRKEFNAKAGTIRPNVFMPRNPSGERLELSVCDIEDMETPAIWSGGEFVAIRRNKTLLARGDFEKELVLEEELEFERDNINFDGHTNIFGWPPDESLQLLKATVFSKATLLVLKP